MSGPEITNLIDLQKLPCGCLIGQSAMPDGSLAFVMKPCSSSCEYYQYALAEAARQGKPMVPKMLDE
jgi:hypothetical protein